MLDTYANLKATVIQWGQRGTSLDLLIDDFIDLAESEMFANQVEPLQLRFQETIGTLTTSITTRFASLPTGYQSMRKLRVQIVNGQSCEIFYRTPAQLNIRSDAGLPQFFTVTDQIEFDRISDQVYTGEFQYFKDFTPLSATATTNTILTNHPTIYLFGAMWALKLHVEELPESDNYYNKFIAAIKGANKKDWMGRYGPAPVMRIEGPTP